MKVAKANYSLWLSQLENRYGVQWRQCTAMPQMKKKVKLTVTACSCRGGYCKTGDTFVVADLCPPLCHELWHTIYPMVYALQNGAVLDYGDSRATCFDAGCPDGGRVRIHGEVLD